MYMDHFHSRDQIPDNCCYTAIFVYRYVNKSTASFEKRWFCAKLWAAEIKVDGIKDYI